MSHLRLFALTTILAALSASAFAQSQQTDIRPDAVRLSGQALVLAFADVTHEGAYNFSRAGEPTRFYTESTSLDDDFAIPSGRTGGTAEYSENGTTVSGSWRIESNRKSEDIICYSYADSAMNGGCFRVWQVGNCYYFYDNEFHERQNEIDRNYWTARSTPKGEIPTCEPGMS